MASLGNTRLMLWLALGVILYFNYQTWMHDYAPAPVSSVSANSSGNTLTDVVPKADSTLSAPGVAAPTSAVPPASAAAFTAIAAGTPPAGDGNARVSPVRVLTDVLDVQINLKGGELERASLRQYPLRKDDPNLSVLLFNRDAESSLFVLQSGLTGGGGAEPNHLAVFGAAAASYTLQDAAQELRVPMVWSDGQGLSVTKTFVFRRGSYSVDLLYEVQNAGATPRKFSSYAQFLRHWEHASRSYFDVETYAFKGPAIYDGVKYRKLNVENDDDKVYTGTITNGWLAAMQHHFVAAIVPGENAAYNYKLQVANNDFLLSATGPPVAIPAGGHAQFKERLFVGPKLQAQLETAGPRLELTADYGKLTVIAKPLFLALKWVHGLVGNWGWAIIIVTALIKLAFYPLSQASGRSMAKMRAVGPRMKQIQETYKEDREKLGRAMMDLYKREKINPLAGCLPMLVQIPVFISFYWVLLESVEMRQAPFMLWVNDLSARDPVFVLPLLMGAAMFAQFKLNPAPPDPMQAKVMQFMPLVMTGMMAWFPAGLVLYWLTNTVLSIAQQWRVNAVVSQEAAKQRS
jgi:YidC/Oxa1 family membrane protein insertase